MSIEFTFVSIIIKHPAVVQYGYLKLTCSFDLVKILFENNFNSYRATYEGIGDGKEVVITGAIGKRGEVVRIKRIVLSLFLYHS